MYSRTSISLIPAFLRALSWVALLLTVVYGAEVTAAQVGGLYDAEVPVAGVEAAERNAAIGGAFEKVLVKVTGNSRVGSRKNLAPDLGNAARYMQQYRYESLPVVNQGEQVRRLLKVSFDKIEVDRLLQSRGLPVWSANRPSVLVWVGEERKSKRNLLNPDLDPDLRVVTDRIAAERGLPLLLPLMDLEDQGQMQVADIWGSFENNIRAASRRYAPDLVLTGRMVQVGKRLWRGEWRLYYSNSQSYWNNEAALRSELMEDALLRTADSVAARYSPIKEERSLSTVRLRVAGIKNLGDYATVLKLLASQSTLERVVVYSVEPEAVVYDLHGQGGVVALQRELGVGGLIEPDPGGAHITDASTIPVDLYYRLR